MTSDPTVGLFFERPEGVIERADRLEANEELPFIIIDAAETSVEIPILQFPLWVAFAVQMMKFMMIRTKLNCMNILIIFISYLLGSLPTGFLIGKYLKNIDLRTIGSGSMVPQMS